MGCLPLRTARLSPGDKGINAAKEIVEKHIVGHELIEGKILDKPSIDIVKQG